MADLEDAGYLVQPHTSAGRVPHGGGLPPVHRVADADAAVPARERRYIDENLKGTPPTPTSCSAAPRHLLSELSNQVGLVVTPELGETVLKAIDFVPVDGRGYSAWWSRSTASSTTR